MPDDSSPEIVELDDASPEALIEAGEARGWGDGLPLIPPTEERVKAMLAETDGDADEVLASLPPRQGEATRRAVAINAVMAGCRPEWMPVVLTAVRALGRPELNLRGVNATTHPVAPLVVVHGAAVDELGFNPGLGAFGPGNRANASVGRTVRFVLLHIAGARPGDGDASTQGGPAKYAYCIGENGPASPWEGYARSVGVDASSAVTVFCGEAPHNVHDMWSEEPARLLEKFASAITSLGSNNAPVADAEVFVVLGPEHVATLAGAGWNRSDVQAYLFETARLPARTMRAAFDQVVWPTWMHAADDDALLPMTARPENYRVLVAGGAGKHSCIIPSWGMTRSVTLPLAG